MDNVILEHSYNNQSKIFSGDSDYEKRLTASWFDETTADYWRHNRMYEAVDCLQHDTSASWVTVGDGRWGLDSIRIKKRGFQNVLPTDICETLLLESKQKGLIDDYSVENAEKLSFANESFDYVFCKESFHHFPRPYMALYEMLRVASKAVFLAEPNDDPVPSTISAKNFIKYKVRSFLSRYRIGTEPKFWGKPYYYQGGYEESGNFVYSISRHEVEKVCQGMNYPQLVVKGINDSYIEGCEFESADVNKSDMFRTIQKDISEQDKRCQQGKSIYSMVLLGLFKTKMDDQTRNMFVNHGFEVIDLPKNPYVK
ncbi:MAG: class I SAM-dependent methyltransferase [Paludibacteraceae bacterium]|jgi:ubiquinone/menaquinone biosynthesis C-methylase UbiE|nr:class I SAM-dependent methyltransferase [Paludibacteraceae bacterium]